MAKITLTLDRRRVRKDGTVPVCLKFTNVNTAALYITPYSVTPSQWRNGRIVNHERANVMNHRLGQLLMQATETMERVCGFVSKHPATYLRDKTMVALEGGEVTLVAPLFRRFIGLKDRQSTIESFRYTFNTLAKLCDIESLTFDDITFDWLTKVERQLLRTVKRNTCAIHLENLRAVVNFAIAEELTTTYAFRRFRIKREASVQRSLSVKEMRALWAMQPADKYLAWYLDIFLLSFTLCGMNIADIYRLKHANIINGRVEINRLKTGVHLSIALTDEARAIIARHKGKEYLLDIAERYRSHKDFLAHCNRGLHKLMPELTTYYARHTWATIASHLGYQNEVVGLGLGHRYGSAVTNIYIRPDLRRLDEANERVLAFVTQKSPTR